MQPAKRGRPIAIRERPPIGWSNLCAIAARTITNAGSFAEWQGRILDKVIEDGYRAPEPSSVHRAIHQCEVAAKRRRDPGAAWLLPPSPPPFRPRLADPPDPTKAIPRADSRSPTRPIAIGQLLSRPIENVCGHSKRGSGIKALRCTRPEGHGGDHGMAISEGGPVIVRWANEGGDLGGTGKDCPHCGRRMSERETREQGACNDCRAGDRG